MFPWIIKNVNLRSEIVHINSNEPLFYHWSVKIDKCSGNCSNINDSYVKLCIPDVTKNINAKVFNLISRTTEIRYIEKYETCKCRCSVCINKQRRNNDKCRYEYKELINKGICDKGLI